MCGNFCQLLLAREIRFCITTRSYSLMQWQKSPRVAGNRSVRVPSLSNLDAMHAVMILSRFVQIVNVCAQTRRKNCPQGKSNLQDHGNWRNSMNHRGQEYTYTDTCSPRSPDGFSSWIDRGSPTASAASRKS